MPMRFGTTCLSSLYPQPMSRIRRGCISSNRLTRAGPEAWCMPAAAGRQVRLKKSLTRLSRCSRRNRLSTVRIRSATVGGHGSDDGIGTPKRLATIRARHSWSITSNCRSANVVVGPSVRPAATGQDGVRYSSMVAMTRSDTREAESNTLSIYSLPSTIADLHAIAREL